MKATKENKKLTLGEELEQQKELEAIQEPETMFGSEALNLAYLAGKDALSEVDKIAANGVIRTSLAVRKHKDELLKKLAYLGLAVISKNVLTSLTDSEIGEAVGNGAIIVTGASAAVTGAKIIKTAWSYDDQAVKAHRRELETAKGGDVKTYEHLF